MAEVKAAEASSEAAHEELLNGSAAVVEAQGEEQQQAHKTEEGGQQQQQDPQPKQQQPEATGLDPAATAAAAAATLGMPLPPADPAAGPHAAAAPPLLPPGLISVADLTASGAGAVPIPLPLLPAAAAAAADATRIGSGPGGQALTFNWTSPPEQDGHRLYYTSFQFCDARYRVGDHVYLIPEDTNAPLYLARIISAFEDTAAEGSEKLCIEVQWYERRANMPESLQAGMHDREVVEWLQTDTNLVGCIERKARVIKARSYEEALAQLSPEEAAGDWHFCRGALDCETLTFFTYDQIDADPNLTYDQRNGMVITATAAMAAAASRASRQAMLFAAGNGAMPGMDVELFQPAGAASSGKRGGRGGRRGGGGGGGRRGARQARAFSGTGEGGIPGQICCECGATSTPQWREGPSGPRTLCNACGMRYQRSQGKGVNRPRRTGSGDGTGSGGPERKSARTTRGRGRGKGRYSSRYDDPFDDEDDEDSADLELTDDDD